jgi:hypothetical protein
MAQQQPFIVNYPREKEPFFTPGEKKTAGIGAGGAAGAGYLYARGLKGENRWRDIPSKARRSSVFGQALRKGEAPGAAEHITSTIRRGVIGTGRDIVGSAGGIWGGLKGAGRGLIGKKLSARHGKLIELSAKLDDLIEFQYGGPEFGQGLAVGMQLGRQQTRRRYEERKEHEPVRRHHGFAKLGTIFGLGTLTGAGVATGSVATRKALSSVARFLNPKIK